MYCCCCLLLLGVNGFVVVVRCAFRLLLGVVCLLFVCSLFVGVCCVLFVVVRRWWSLAVACGRCLLFDDICRCLLLVVGR